MQQGGVQPESALGMKWHVPGQPEPRSRAEQQQDRRIDDLTRQVQQTGADAEDLYRALRDAVAYARERTPEAERMPDDVEDGALLLARLAQYDPTSTVRDCPSCEQGKHDTCDGVVIPDDVEIECPCAARNHDR